MHSYTHSLDDVASIDVSFYEVDAFEADLSACLGVAIILGSGARAE